MRTTDSNSHSSSQKNNGNIVVTLGHEVEEIHADKAEEDIQLQDKTNSNSVATLGTTKPQSSNVANFSAEDSAKGPPVPQKGAPAAAGSTVVETQHNKYQRFACNIQDKQTTVMIRNIPNVFFLSLICNFFFSWNYKFFRSIA